MNNKQYKPSETDSQIDREWRGQDLLTFTAYFKINTALSSCRISTYDHDINSKFISKSKNLAKVDESEMSVRSKKQSEKSVKSKSNVTKSGRPKVERINKLDMPMFHEPDSKLVSKISPVSNVKEQEGDNHFLPSFLAEHSNLPQKNKSNSLNIVEQNTPILHNILNETFSHQQFSPQQEEQHEKVELPMLQKIEHSQQLYLGERAKNIQTLNQFLVQPTSQDGSKFITNKINKDLIDKSNRKEKMEGFRIALPQTHQKTIKKESELNNNEYINGYRIIQSRLVEEARQQKSKSKPKKVKDSSLNVLKPKFKQPFIQHSVQKEREETPKKQQTVTEINLQKVTPYKSRNINKQNKQNGKSNRNEVIPVQDYDEGLDESRQVRIAENYEEVMSQCQQNIKINQMPHIVKHHFPLSGRSNGSQSNSSNKFQKVQVIEDAALQFFAIPLQKIKQKKSKESSKEQFKPQKMIEENGRQQLQQNSKQETFKKKQGSERSSRKKIFSQTDKEVKQKREKEITEKSQNSTDITDYTQQQMRMIMGAKGNKYKQMIIKQYIRINRATNRQNNLSE